MKIVHSKLSTEPAPKRPTKKELYHEEQLQKLRRRQFQDFKQALNDPEVKAAIETVRKVSQGWEPKFRG